MSNLRELSSDRIREKLQESGIKQVHLARKLGVSPQHLNKILSRNQERGQYMSKMAALLGMDESSTPSTTRLIPLFTEDDLKSLASEATSFDDLAEMTLQSCPSFIPDDHACFGYALTENIASHSLKNDIIIFSTRLPLNMTGRMGIAFIEKTASVVIGTLRQHKNTITLYNECDCIDCQSGDLLFGVGVHLERNLEKP